MVYRFIIISNEVEDFMREIKIDAGATFFDLHQAIVDNCGYDSSEMASFTICENGWEKAQEITLFDMDTQSDQDSYVMDSTKLNELLIDEKQHLLYTFDMLAERMFFIELSEIISGKHLDKPVVSRSQGNPPQQKMDFDDLMAMNPVTGDSDFIDDDMTSDEFNDEDLDISGLDISDGEPF